MFDIYSSPMSGPNRSVPEQAEHNEPELSRTCAAIDQELRQEALARETARVFSGQDNVEVWKSDAGI